MVEYNTVNVILLDSELKKFNSAVKNRQRTTLRMNTKMFCENNLCHKLLLTARHN